MIKKIFEQGMKEPEANSRVQLDVDWKQAESAVMYEVLTLMGNVLSSKQVTLLSAIMPFYSEYKLYKLIAVTMPTDNSLYFLHKPGYMLLMMDWTSEPIYKLNEIAPIILNADTLIPYAKFFFHYVREQLGDFIIVEKLEDIVWLPEATHEEKNAVAARLMSVTYKGIDYEGLFTLTCTVIFKNALFRTDIKIAPHEMEVIDSDLGEKEHFSIGQMKLVNEELLCEELNVPFSTIPKEIKTGDVSEHIK
jgi:hypothetical protein